MYEPDNEKRKMHLAKVKYAHLGDIERRLRKELKEARRAQKEEKAEKLWAQIREIQEKRRNTSYYKNVITPSRENNDK